MRFALSFKIEKKVLPSDNRRIFMSFLKKSFQEYDKKIFNRYYKDRDNIEKPFTFAVYFGKAEFTREKIYLKHNKITLTFSTADLETGLHFYNSVLNQKGKVFPLEGNNRLVLEDISLVKESPIIGERIIFQTLSPILIRKHQREGNRDWYYSFEDEESMAILKNSMRYQAVNYFGSYVEKDVEEIVIQPIEMKSLVLTHYGVFLAGNVGIFEMKGKTYLLEYFYKAGISARKSEGFGLVKSVE